MVTTASRPYMTLVNIRASVTVGGCITSQYAEFYIGFIVQVVCLVQAYMLT